MTKIKILLSATLLIIGNACSSSPKSEEDKTSIATTSEVTSVSSFEMRMKNEKIQSTKTASMENTNESIYDGIYISAGSRPRMYILNKGKFIKYNRKMNDDLPTGHYYERDLISTFNVEDDNLVSPDYDYDAHFIKEGNKVIAMADRFVKTIKANSLKDIFSKNEWDAKPLLNYLIEKEGIEGEEAKNLFLREDLWDQIKSVDFEEKTKISMKELALNFTNSSFTKVERVADKSSYDGVYGFAKNGSSGISDIMVVKNSRFVWFDVFWDTAGGTKNALIFKPITTKDSGEAVEIKNNRYSYTRDRYKGQFIIENGVVTGVTDGNTELTKYDTFEEMMKLNPAMDAREILSQMVNKHQMDENKVKAKITKTLLIEHFDISKLDKRTTFAELIK